MFIQNLNLRKRLGMGKLLEADAGAGVNGSGNNTDTTTTDTSNEENETKEKTFTQADVDKLIKESLAREKKGQPTKAEMEAFRTWKESQKTKEEKEAEKVTQAESKMKEAEERAIIAETKVACLSKGVKADCIDDVVTLAKAIANDNTTMDKAIDKVLEKYPSFLKEQQNSNGFRIGAKASGNENKANQDKLLAAFGIKK